MNKNIIKKILFYTFIILIIAGFGLIGTKYWGLTTSQIKIITYIMMAILGGSYYAYTFLKETQKCPHCQKDWCYKTIEKLKEKDKSYETFEDEDICDLFLTRHYYDNVDYNNYKIKKCKKCNEQDKVYIKTTTETTENRTNTVCKNCESIDSMVKIDNGVNYGNTYEKVKRKDLDGSLSTLDFKDHLHKIEYKHITYRPYEKWQELKCNQCGKTSTFVYDSGEEEINSWRETKIEEVDATDFFRDKM